MAPEMTTPSARTRQRRGFTLVELIVAGMVSLIVVGAVTMSLSRIGRGREVATRRLDAHVRATLALDAIRRDLASVMRSSNLLETRVLIMDGAITDRAGDLDRDELLVFSNRLSSARPPDRYQGEGSEYETQFRVMDDELGSALWTRRDPVPDRNPDAGGVAIPVVDGVVALQLEAYDGESWYPDWDSDMYGLPWAVRATVTALGRKVGDDDPLNDDAYVTLRTTIPVDRVPPPPQEEEESKEENAVDEAAAAAEEAILNGGAAGGEVVIPGGPGLGGEGSGGRGDGPRGDGGPRGGGGGAIGGPRGGRGGGNGYMRGGNRGGRGASGMSGRGAT